MPTVIAAGGRLLARVAAPILLAAGLCACSSIPDWVDPTTWIGGGPGTDDQSGTNPDSAQASDAGQAQGGTPDLASIPPRPGAPSSADEQKQVANSLEADRAKAQYSADALRGGTEAAAAPPPAEPPPSAAEPTSSATPAPADAASTDAPPPASDAGLSAPPGASGAAEADTTPAGTPPAAPAAGQVASTDAANTTAAAAAPMAAESTSAPAVGDMQATFAPSKAPPLDPSVAQFVPQPILSRYQQTAAGAAAPGIAGATNPAPSPKHRHHKKTQSSNAARLPRLAAVTMDGDRRAEIFLQT